MVPYAYPHEKAFSSNKKTKNASNKSRKQNFSDDDEITLYVRQQMKNYRGVAECQNRLF